MSVRNLLRKLSPNRNSSPHNTWESVVLCGSKLETGYRCFLSEGCVKGTGRVVTLVIRRRLNLTALVFIRVNAYILSFYFIFVRECFGGGVLYV